MRTIGKVGDTSAESEAILLEHEVNTAPFSAQVLVTAAAYTIACTHMNGFVATSLSSSYKFNLPVLPLPLVCYTQIQACLPAKGWTIPSDEIARRLDLRNGRALVCSVDPPGCVDIDDALHASPMEPGPDGTKRFEVKALAHTLN